MAVLLITTMRLQVLYGWRRYLSLLRRYFSKIGKNYLTSYLLELDFRGVVLFCYRGKVDPSFGSNFFSSYFFVFLSLVYGSCLTPRCKYLIFRIKFILFEIDCEKILERPNLSYELCSSCKQEFSLEELQRFVIP